MGGSKINQKLGLKPNTRKRAMMKGAGKDAAARIRTSRACPQCPHRWIVVNVILGAELALCAWCGWQGLPTEAHV